jgi:hypothetical protein
MVLAQKKQKVGGKKKEKNPMWKGALVIGQGTIATMAIVAIALMSDRQNYVGQKTKPPPPPPPPPTLSRWKIMLYFNIT